MAFVINEKKAEEGSESKKQHLNISPLAYEILSNDMFAFGKDSINGFINEVFRNYYSNADASIGLKINLLSGELSILLENLTEDKTKSKIIKKIIEARKDELKAKSSSYEKGEGLKFSLQKDNYSYLTERDSECEENNYYDRRGQYIKSVIEEYARLPFYERELIFFKPFADSANEAIEKKCQLKVVTYKNKVFSVYPYKILCDPLSTSNYLVGYSKPYNSDAEIIPCSFRLSSLRSVNVEISKSGFLKKEKCTILEKKLSSRGVQFMIGNEEEIKVRLTDIGVEKLHRQSHLRPTKYEKIENEHNVFIFMCTPVQAEAYFFKFGMHAEIISPPELREKFQTMYKEAFDTYNK